MLLQCLYWNGEKFSVGILTVHHPWQVLPSSFPIALVSRMVPQLCMEFAGLLLQSPENRVYRLCHHTQVSIFQMETFSSALGTGPRAFLCLVTSPLSAITSCLEMVQLLRVSAALAEGPQVQVPYPHWVAYNCLKHQLLGDQILLPSVGTLTLVLIIHWYKLIHIILKSKSFKKLFWDRVLLYLLPRLALTPSVVFICDPPASAPTADIPLTVLRPN